MYTIEMFDQRINEWYAVANCIDLEWAKLLASRYAATVRMKDYPTGEVASNGMDYSIITAADLILVSRVVLTTPDRDHENLAEALRQIMHNHRVIPIDTPIGEVVTILQEMLQASRSLAFKALGMDKVYAELDDAESL